MASEEEDVDSHLPLLHPDGLLGGDERAGRDPGGEAGEAGGEGPLQLLQPHHPVCPGHHLRWAPSCTTCVQPRFILVKVTSENLSFQKLQWERKFTPRVILTPSMFGVCTSEFFAFFSLSQKQSGNNYLINNLMFLSSPLGWVTLSAADRGRPGSGLTLCTSASARAGSMKRRSRSSTPSRTRWVMAPVVWKPALHLRSLTRDDAEEATFSRNQSRHFISGDTRKSREHLRQRLWPGHEEKAGLPGHASEYHIRGRQQDEPPGHSGGSGHLYV